MSQEIKENIARLEGEIEDILRNGLFVYSKEINQKRQEIAEYKKKCKHSCKYGKCEYCGEVING